MPNSFESHRKGWNKQQTELRRVLMSFKQHPRAIELFLSQHAALHSATMASTEPWSFEDELFAGLSEAQIRCIPPNTSHSIAWNIWHLARIEDVTMNVLVVGKPQLLNSDNWFRRLRVDARDTGNLMDAKDIAQVSATIDIKPLRAYRAAVGRRTRDIVLRLSPQDLKRKVDPARLEQLMAEGAVTEQAHSLIDYWRRLDVAGLLLMPPTRHGFVHLNESWRIKHQVMKEKYA